MNKRSMTGSLGVSSTASRSSSPLRTVSRRGTYFPVQSYFHIRSFLLTFFLCFFVLHFIIAAPTRNSPGKHSYMSTHFILPYCRVFNCYLRSAIRSGSTALISYIITDYSFFLQLIPCESEFCCCCRLITSNQLVYKLIILTSVEMNVQNKFYLPPTFGNVAI